MVRHAGAAPPPAVWKRRTVTSRSCEDYFGVVSGWVSSALASLLASQRGAPRCGRCIRTRKHAHLTWASAWRPLWQDILLTHWCIPAEFCCQWS